MVAVGVVKVTADQVVDVLAVRDRLVAALRSVLVSGLVFGAVVARRAVSGVGFADREGVALDATLLVVVMELAVVEVIDVIVVADSGVAATRTVLVLVYVGGHALASFS